jgi:hypothetical protein
VLLDIAVVRVERDLVEKPRSLFVVREFILLNALFIGASPISIARQSLWRKVRESD